MPETGGRVGGYCDLSWIKAAQSRERFKPYADAIAKVASAGVATDEVEWALLQCSILPDTGRLKYSVIDPIVGVEISCDRYPS
jgi:hypothetical protein